MSARYRDCVWVESGRQQASRFDIMGFGFVFCRNEVCYDDLEQEDHSYARYGPRGGNVIIADSLGS